jgi:hypothetical protein
VSKVALASEGLTTDLRDCLIGKGITVIAADQAGTVTLQTSGGQALSTREGLRTTIVNAGRWKSANQLRDPVGLVGELPDKAQIDAAASDLERLGVHVASRAYLSGSTLDVSSGVRDFASAGVKTVIFAALVNDQRNWAAQAVILDPSVQYVVTDAYDGIVNEQYTPAFDGSMAYTSMRVSWYARTHGATAPQQQCQKAWEGSVAPATTLDNNEVIRAYKWCADIAIVASAVRNIAGSTDLAHALATVTVESPLTSNLGPRINSDWGPTQNAALQWSASCSCWTEKQPFG